MTMVPSSSDSTCSRRRFLVVALLLGALAIASAVTEYRRHNQRYRFTATQRIRNDEDAILSPTITRQPFLISRGGYQQKEADDEISLDEKVRRAMEKLGLKTPDEEDEQETADTNNNNNNNDECSGGVCEMPETEQQKLQQNDKDADDIAARLAAELNVDVSLAMAAVGATRKSDQSFDESGARALLQQELDRIGQVAEDSEAIQTLVDEGFDKFLSRRALAFADMNVDDARAILLADQMDLEEQQQEEAAAAAAATQNEQAPMKEEPFKTVTVDTDFDPAAIKTSEQTMPQAPAPSAGGAPKPANKADVVFEATASQIQELVLESPVPVLLDVYADWCGPCKVLGPALEEMAVKAGGAFRLVKVNTDNERAVSSSLEVTALPTVFGIRDGRILNMFQGMPQSEKAMQNFMMGLLMGESTFDPPLTGEQKKQFHAITMKLIKMAGAACFSFSSRERLQDRVNGRLDELALQTGDFVDAEASTRILRSLLSNVLRDPYEQKYRTVNLKNNAIATNVAQYPAGMAILKSVGFRPTSSEEDCDSLVLKKKVVNVAPLLVARDCIDKWIDKSRHEVAKAARKRKDEEDRATLQKELAERGDVEEEDEEERVVVDPNACNLKLRMEGKKKVHDVSLRADDPLRSVLEHLPVSVDAGQEVQITCVAKRLVVKSGDETMMSKSLRELRLTPAASIVVAVGSKSGVSKEDGGSSLSQRAAKDKKRKKGSHTMQSVGIYSKDDNAKAELIDGGGGVWYEHDVTTDDEGEEEEKNEASEEESGDTGDGLDDEGDEKEEGEGEE